MIVSAKPMVFARARRTKPGAKMSGEGVEIRAQTIGQESGDVLRLKTAFEVVDECQGILFGASADMQGRNSFADGIAGEPEPACGSAAAHARVEFIQLQHSKG